MTAKEQLLQELSSIPDNLIVETLNFVRFLKTQERTNLSAAAEMMRNFYAEGSELTEFSDRADEDFYEYENYA
jgi:propanediol dehydratase small subunit